MAEHGEAGDCAVHGAAGPHPFGAGFVAFDTVGDAFAGEELAGRAFVPCLVTTEADAAVVIPGQLERRIAGAGLGGGEVEHVARGLLIARSGGADFPGLQQRGFGWRGEQVHELMARFEAGGAVLFPDIVHGHKLHAALVVAHVPEVRLAALELRLRPRPPDAVVMNVLHGEVITNLFARRRAQRGKIAAAAKGFFYFRARQRSRLGLVAEHFAVPGAEDDLRALALGSDGGAGESSGGKGEEQKGAEHAAAERQAPARQAFTAARIRAGAGLRRARTQRCHRAQ